MPGSHAQCPENYTASPARNQTAAWLPFQLLELLSLEGAPCPSNRLSPATIEHLTYYPARVSHFLPLKLTPNTPNAEKCF